jgi:hypothetical protein
MTHQQLIDMIDLKAKVNGKPRFTFYDAAKGLEVTDRKTGKRHFIRNYNYWELYLEKTGVIGPLKTSRQTKSVVRGKAKAQSPRGKRGTSCRLTRG